MAALATELSGHGARKCPLVPFVRAHCLFYYLRLLGRWVSAEPEAVFAALLVSGLRSTFDAAVAEELDVTFSGAFLWDKAEPAADLADLVALGFRNTLDAAVAARFPVTSLF